MQVLETVILQEEGPACKSGADAPLQPLKSLLELAAQGENTSNLIIRVVRVAK